jgi:hypothetical protein
MFTPMSVYKDFSDFEYIGGELGLSNPTGEIIAEAHRAFGDDATVACLLSIGCGHTGIKSSPYDSGAATWIDFLNRVSMDSEKTAPEMAHRMKHLTLYHRLSVDNGLPTDRLDVWRDPVVIAAHTTTYLGNLEVVERLNRCVDTIIHGDGFTTLEQLSESILGTHLSFTNCTRSFGRCQGFLTSYATTHTSLRGTKGSNEIRGERTLRSTGRYQTRVQDHYGDGDRRVREDATDSQIYSTAWGSVN